MIESGRFNFTNAVVDLKWEGLGNGRHEAEGSGRQVNHVLDGSACGSNFGTASRIKILKTVAEFLTSPETDSAL